MVAWEVVVGIAGGLYFLARRVMDPLLTAALTVPSIVIVGSGLAVLAPGRGARRDRSGLPAAD